MGILDRLLGRRESAGAKTAGTATGGDPRFERYLADARVGAIDRSESLAAMLAASPREQADLRGPPLLPQSAHWRLESATRDLIDRLLRRSLPFTGDDLIDQLDGTLWAPHLLSVRSALGAIEHHLAGSRPTGALRGALERAERALRGAQGSEPLQLAERIAAALASPPRTELVIQAVDAWTQRLLAALAADPALARAAEPLLEHAVRARAPRPSARWSREAAARASALGPERHRALLVGALEAVGTRGPDTAREPSLVSHEHADLLRGLIWSAAGSDDTRLAAALADAAERCFEKVPGIGPRAPKIGNACLFALASLPAREAVAQLTRLRSRVRHASSLRSVEKALAGVAARTGTSTAGSGIAWRPADRRVQRILPAAQRASRAAQRVMYVPTDAERATRFAAHILRQHGLHALRERGWHPELWVEIAERCSLGERTLCVRGALGTHHIPIGSGNVLVSPNDEHLCIVPAERADADALLPFAGDPALSLILPKAFLLGEDRSIRDPSSILLRVGDQQAESLDQAIVLGPDVVVSFVKLVPLVGG